MSIGGQEDRRKVLRDNSVGWRSKAGQDKEVEADCENLSMAHDVGLGLDSMAAEEPQEGGRSYFDKENEEVEGIAEEEGCRTY